jgi:2-polyprenyl-6-methoxyphenol hydroxylase-like FAD-dependent oxidoreductase
VGIHALVVGGGIAGLSAAIGLRRAGMEVTVFEAAPALREAGAGLSLWVNGMAALERHGLASAVADVGSTIEIQESRSRRGIRYSSVPVGRQARSYGLPPPEVVRRTDLLNVLASGVPGEVIRLDARGVDFDADASGVTLHLADGRHARGSLLIGADGINSAVRARLFPGARPRYAGYQSLRGLVRFEHDLVTPGTFTMTHGRGDRFGFSSAGQGWLWWFGVMPLPEGSTDPPGGRKWELLQHFGRFCAPVPEIIEATPEESILRNDVRDIAPMPRWGEGRVTLVGDAAHATTVGGGRGASEAIEDGVVLGQFLAPAASASEEDAVVSALRSFDGARMAPTAAVQVRSWQYGVSASWTNPVACAARGVMMATAWRRKAEQGMHAEFARFRGPAA